MSMSNRKNPKSYQRSRRTTVDILEGPLQPLLYDQARQMSAPLSSPAPSTQSEPSTQAASSRRGKRGRSSTPTMNIEKKPRLQRSAFSNPLPERIAPPSHPHAATPPQEAKRALLIWGSGDMGQHGLGIDTLDEIQRPMLHEWADEQTQLGNLGPHGLEQVAAGWLHTLVLDSFGRIWSWGINDNASLGRSTMRDPTVPSEDCETLPMLVEGLSPTGYGVVATGPNAGQWGAVEKFRATRIAASGACSLALNEQGKLRVWGSFRSNEGLLGFDPSPTAARLQFDPRPLQGLSKVRFSSVSCGADHMLALSTEGQVWAWGNGQQCQLGRKVIERRKHNALVPAKLTLRKIVHVGCGAYHSFAVDVDGQVFAWGLNTFGQLGVETEEDQVVEPMVVQPLSPSQHNGAKVVQIDAGSHFSLFLLNNGQVWGTGRCDGNELGLPETHPAKRTLLQAREEWEREHNAQFQQEIEQFEQRRFAVESQGVPLDLIEADESSPTPLISPPDEYLAEPVQIPFPDGAHIVQISAGPRYAVAVGSNGQAYTWGLGQVSELGQAR